ncbi:MAG: flagellar biosynthesis protein FlhF-like protein [Pseudomonadota bacterium]
MRMKMFAADSFDAAKDMILAELGADAVILSEREVDGGVEVRAAVDRLGGAGRDMPMFLQRPEDDKAVVGLDASLRQRLRDMLLWHGAPKRFAERLAAAGAGQRLGPQEPEDALAAGLEAQLAFDPIPAKPDRHILLVGPPGHGRTATAAKLTRRAAVAQTEVFPIAADFDGAAGGAQLSAYLERERAQIRIATDPDALFSMLAEAEADGSRFIIDLPAITPFDTEDMARLMGLVSAIDAEPVLIMSAEGHPEDQAELARAFAKAGVRRAILTKLDVVRRRGGAVAALAGAKIAFSHIAVTPFIGGGLVPAAPSRLATLLVEDAPGRYALRGAA